MSVLAHFSVCVLLTVHFFAFTGRTAQVRPGGKKKKTLVRLPANGPNCVSKVPAVCQSPAKTRKCLNTHISVSAHAYCYTIILLPVPVHITKRGCYICGAQHNCESRNYKGRKGNDKVLTTRTHVYIQYIYTLAARC